MIGNCIRIGFTSAWKNPRLAALLWGWNLALAALGSLPLFYWWQAAFGRAPEADRLLDGLSLPVLAELAQYDRSPSWGIVMIPLLGIVLLTVAGNAFFAGGVIEVLVRGEKAGGLLQHFFGGAVRFFKRYLALLLLSTTSAGVLLGLLWAAARGIQKLVPDTGWEPAPLAGALLRVLVGLAVLAFLYAALDYARIETALRGSRRIFRVWTSGLGFAASHILGVFLLLMATGAAVALVLAAYAAFRQSVTPRTWLLIALVFIVQQLTVFTRLGLRIGLLAGQIDLYRRLSPAAAAPEPDAPEATAAAGSPAPAADPVDQDPSRALPNPDEPAPNM